MMLGRPLAISPEKGASTSVWARVRTRGRRDDRRLLLQVQPASTSRAATDADATRRLWTSSEQLVGMRPTRRSGPREMPTTGMTPAKSANGLPPPSGSGGPETPFTSFWYPTAQYVYQLQRILVLLRRTGD